MIRHLLKLVWRRKGANALLTVEIFVCFLVVFAVAAGSLHFAANWTRPLGYAWKEVWNVSVDVGGAFDDPWTEEQAARLAALLREAESLDRVEAAAAVGSAPYEFSTSTGDIWHGTRSTVAMFSLATDDLAAVLGIDPVAGRWFSREDAGRPERAIVINRRLAEELFGDESAVGQILNRGRNASIGGDHDLRVVGVVDEYRQHGELASSEPYAFVRWDLATTGERAPRELVLRMAPGTPAAYEEELLGKLRAVAPGWSLDVEPLGKLRHARLRYQLTPLVAGGTVAAFLLLMAGLGLSGVLWQNVTQRTRELGLRRAKGATRARVRRQIVIEVVLLTSVAVAAGLILVAQLPLLELLGPLRPGVLAAAAGTTALLVYAMALLAGWYPSRLATRVEPAEALRYE